MKCKGIDNKEYPIHVEKYIVNGLSQKSRSSLHLEARKLLKSVFPTDILLEEVPVYGCKTRLFLDFFIPQQHLVVEVQGEQHYKFCPFFHKNKQAFIEAKKRDNYKKEWCEINSFLMIELPYNQISDWRQKIEQRWD